jgi:hypothetical protein
MALYYFAFDDIISVCLTIKLRTKPTVVLASVTKAMAEPRVAESAKTGKADKQRSGRNLV